MGSPGGGENDVGLVQLIEQVVEADRLAVEFVRQPLRPLEGPVGNHQPAHAVVEEVLGRQFAHLAGADQHDGLVGEIVEDLAGQLHGGKGDGNRRGGDLRFGADPLGNGKGLVEKTVEDDARGPVFGGVTVGCLDLAENLRFTYHHGVEAGGNAEDVADGVFAMECIKVRLQALQRYLVVVGQEALYPGYAAGDVPGGDIDFDPVAGGDDDRFGDVIHGDQRVERFLHMGRRKGNLFPDFDRSGFM